tara:strand:+ start:665 stop:904 length:240 start_codon:yes stop_codon:yes gene_type:complete
MNNRNFGTFVRKQLNDIDRSNEWLYRRTGIGTGAVNRWCDGQEPTLSNSINVFVYLANQKQTTLLRMTEMYYIYLGLIR